MSMRHLNLSKAPFIFCLTELLLLIGSLCMPCPQFQRVGNDLWGRRQRKEAVIVWKTYIPFLQSWAILLP